MCVLLKNGAVYMNTDMFKGKLTVEQRAGSFEGIIRHFGDRISNKIMLALTDKEGGGF